METENTNIETNETELATEQEQGQEKTYTEAEVMTLLQREADKRVTAALKKQASQYEKKLSLSKLDENERASAEKDMRIEELTKKLADYEIEKNRSELKTVLSSRGLSASFADILFIDDDMEASQKRIDTLDKLFKAAVNEEVKKRLGGSSPNMGGSAEKTEHLTKDSFAKLSIQEQARIFKENPELYKYMTQGV